MKYLDVSNANRYAPTSFTGQTRQFHSSNKWSPSSVYTPKAALIDLEYRTFHVLNSAAYTIVLWQGVLFCLRYIKAAIALPFVVMKRNCFRFCEAWGFQSKLIRQSQQDSWPKLRNTSSKGKAAGTRKRRAEHYINISTTSLPI